MRGLRTYHLRYTRVATHRYLDLVMQQLCIVTLHIFPFSVKCVCGAISRRFPKKGRSIVFFAKEIRYPPSETMIRWQNVKMMSRHSKRSSKPSRNPSLGVGEFCDEISKTVWKM